MRKILIILCLLPFTLQAQSGQMQDYWQQEVNTKIDVRLDDVHHFLHGKISMDYTNNSNDTLSFIYFHLYPNAYQNDRTAYVKQAVENGYVDFYFSKEADRGYIDSLQFFVEEMPAVITPTEHIDIIKLELPELLLPGKSMTISTPFRVRIPKTFSRLGHEGQSYQISQWFPKPAVYDMKGWHPMPYLDQGEFYSEFGTYDVTITLPENYIVMATGNLQDEKESQWLDELSKKSLPADTLFEHAQPASSENLKTLHFQEKNIHDFAWFADKTWIVRKEIIQLESGKEIESFSCYFPKHQEGWKNSLEDIKTAILGYSQQVGDYPYRTVKVVEGALSAGGGMEYPTVTVIAASNNAEMVNTAIIHEVGHNWFYGILGSNERDFPWMDEGINSFYENKFTKKNKTLNALTKGKGINFLAYSFFASTHQLQPADLPSVDFRDLNYGIDVYMKMPFLLNWLEGYMGADTFQKAMKKYFELFQFKHPQPEDFETVFKNQTNKDINWFFKGLNNQNGIDFALQSVENQSDSFAVHLKNKTGFEGPVLVRVYGKDNQGNLVEEYLWSNPFEDKTTIHLKNSKHIKWQGAAIDGVVPDFRIKNNSSSTSFGLGLFAGLNLQPANKVWISPAIGYNYYDGFMAGLLFHNLTIPENKIQFALAPLYGFKSQQFAGTGIIGTTFYPQNGVFQSIQLNFEGKTFDYKQSNLNVVDPVSARFIKVAPVLTFTFRKPYARSPLERSLTLKGYFIREESLTFIKDSSDDLFRPETDGLQDNFYGKMNYHFNKATTFNPYSYDLEVQMGKAFAKLSAEANFKVDYFLKNKAFYARFYVGKLFFFNDDLNSSRYHLSTTFTGLNDYLYDETYLSRTEQGGNGWQNQVSVREGGFKMNTLKYAQPLGFSDDWLFSANFKTDIPYLPLPIRVFADVATFTGAKVTNPSESSVLFEAGLELYIGNVFSIYLPLILSKDLNDYSQTVLGKGRYGKMIGFSLNLSDVKWLKIPEMLLKIK